MYSFALRLAALWNPKAKLWVEGRRGWRKEVSGQRSKVKGQELGVISQESGVGSQELSVKRQRLKVIGEETVTLSSNTIWMHCASLGEFEQGRPLLEAVRKDYPGYKIVLTFFSPSGYEIRKNYAGADVVMYLPMDSRANAKDFINAINPSLVLWVKYEYWYYYLSELKKRKIPVLLISGIFRSSQPFFKWYGGLWKNILKCFNHFFVQTAHSKALLKNIGIDKPVTVTGDTRFDRVTAIAQQWEKLNDAVEQFCQGHPVLVAGSTWEDDEALLIHYARAYPKTRFIIAPHEVDKERIEELQQEFSQAVLYSSVINKTITVHADFNVLIIDNVGLLSRLYKYASITYVGGGFNQSGIHNILEAAVYGKPVIFGPVYEKFAEARDLVDNGGAFSIETALELEALLHQLFNNTEKLNKSSAAAKEYVQSHKGATAQIMQYIQIKRLLMS